MFEERVWWWAGRVFTEGFGARCIFPTALLRTSTAMISYGVFSLFGYEP
jgi:hypothetical protein